MFELSVSLALLDGEASKSTSVAFEQFDEIRSNLLLQVLSLQFDKGIVNELQLMPELNFVEYVTVTV